jgi:hypothetical protein
MAEHSLLQTTAMMSKPKIGWASASPEIAVSQEKGMVSGRPV